MKTSTLTPATVYFQVALMVGKLRARALFNGYVNESAQLSEAHRWRAVPWFSAAEWHSPSYPCDPKESRLESLKVKDLVGFVKWNPTRDELDTDNDHTSKTIAF